MRSFDLTSKLRQLSAAAVIAVGATFAVPANAGPQYVVALGGYDAVAYFTDGTPTEGAVTISHHWNGANWLFSSAENRDQFAANPETYAPQFDGYCAYAAALGYIAPGDPTVWAVVDDRLYLNVHERAAELWQQDRDANIASAEENWPRLNSN